MRPAKKMYHFALAATKNLYFRLAFVYIYCQLDDNFGVKVKNNCAQTSIAWVTLCFKEVVDISDLLCKFVGTQTLSC
jgi:hypothetical protein